jgi:hypothetical protein
VRKLLASLAALAGLAALVRRRRRSTPPADVPDPAEALRAKLAEQRSADSPEPAPPVEAVDELSLDERRAAVHERAQETIRSMQPDDDA